MGRKGVGGFLYLSVLISIYPDLGSEFLVFWTGEFYCDGNVVASWDFEVEFFSEERYGWASGLEFLACFPVVCIEAGEMPAETFTVESACLLG